METCCKLTSSRSFVKDGNTLLLLRFFLENVQLLFLFSSKKQKSFTICKDCAVKFSWSFIPETKEKVCVGLKGLNGIRRSR